MNPPVPSDFNANVIFLITVIAFLGGIWWRIEGSISKAKLEALTQAQAAAAIATLAQAQLSEHKLHVAETFVTKHGLQEQTGAMLQAINGLRDDFKNLNGRIDRMFEGGPTPGRRAPGK
jgi:hypothetical protein